MSETKAYQDGADRAQRLKSSRIDNGFKTITDAIVLPVIGVGIKGGGFDPPIAARAV